MNFKNHTIWTGDNLPIMRGLNSESVDLIYLDPPFNSKKNYAAPIGSKAAGAAFKDTWTLDDVDRLWLLLLRDKDPVLYHVIEGARLVHGNGMASYLSMMAQRLGEMRRILKPAGSLYLHCDPTVSHYLKLLMDSVFGKNQFRNEIIWHYGGRMMHKVSQYNRKHDVILYYTRNLTGYTFALPKDPIDFEKYAAARHEKIHQDSEGKRYLLAPDANRNRTIKQYEEDLVRNGRAIDDVWEIRYIRGNAKERTGYPTQKPIKLLERIIKASSNEGDTVFDPFCGCATACIAAERHGRQWLGIDISEKAAELVQVRVRKEINLLHNFRPIHRTDQPQRTDLGKLPPPLAHKDLLYGKQSGQCGGCMVMFPKRNLTMDHIVPQKKGGTDHVENLWLLCGACNSSKGTKSQAEFLKERVKRGESIEWLL